MTWGQLFGRFIAFALTVGFLIECWISPKSGPWYEKLGLTLLVMLVWHMAFKSLREKRKEEEAAASDQAEAGRAAD